jgi:ubiquinone/menaquinone biosynthesis C-methylase UbiE
MTSNEMTIDADGAALQEPRRIPHHCPWWGGPFLASPLRRLVERPEPLLEPYVEPGMRVLDFGSAMGFFSLPLARMVGAQGRVVCADVQPRMIAGLLKRARKAGLADRLETIVCGEQDLGLSAQEGRIDLAVAIHVIHEVHDIAGTFQQLARSLKPPRARLLVIEPRGHVTQVLFDFELQAARRAGLLVEETPPLLRRRAALLRRDGFGRAAAGG